MKKHTDKRSLYSRVRVGQALWPRVPGAETESKRTSSSAQASRDKGGVGWSRDPVAASHTPPGLPPCLNIQHPFEITYILFICID